MQKIKSLIIVAVFFSGITSCNEKRYKLEDNKESIPVYIDTLLKKQDFQYYNFYENKFLPDSLLNEVPTFYNLTELNVHKVFIFPEYSKKQLNNYDLCEILAETEKYLYKMTDRDLKSRSISIRDYLSVSLVGKVKFNEKFDSYLVTTFYKDPREINKQLYLINMQKNKVCSAFLASEYHLFIPHGYTQSSTRTNGQYFLLREENTFHLQDNNQNIGLKNEVYCTTFYLDENGFIQLCK